MTPRELFRGRLEGGDMLPYKIEEARTMACMKEDRLRMSFGTWNKIGRLRHPFRRAGRKTANDRRTQTRADVILCRARADEAPDEGERHVQELGKDVTPKSRGDVVESGGSPRLRQPSLQLAALSLRHSVYHRIIQKDTI